MNKHTYLIQTSSQLSFSTIQAILHLWQVQEWKDLKEEAFRSKFRNSQFHLLLSEQAQVLSVARINFEFCIEVDTVRYTYGEFVGFVSVEKRKGYGSELLRHMKNTLDSRSIEVIGFCEKHVRIFYEKCHIPVLYDQALYFRERTENTWTATTDNDILDITLSDKGRELFQSLNNKRLAYLVNC